MRRPTNRDSESVDGEHVGATGEENLRLMSIVVCRDCNQIVHRDRLDVELVRTSVVRSDGQCLHDIRLAIDV
jgi:hypothetical protein